VFNCAAFNSSGFPNAPKSGSVFTVGGTIFVASDKEVPPWNSRLLPLIDGQYTAATIQFSGRTWTLDDYSYVGYFLGTRSLGSVVCNPIDVSASGDITQALQAAVNAVWQAGGGIVRIPAGTFGMSAPVMVPYSNISIEGAGSGQTGP
jgi:hypothetical protein